MNITRRNFIAVIGAAICFHTYIANAENIPADSPKGIANSLVGFVEQNVLAGAVTAVVDKNGIQSLESVGYSDVAQKQPMKTDGIFWIASMSKPITATALMMLVDEGKVKLDDPVEKYLPEFKGQMVIAEKDDNHVLLKKPTRPVTVRNILSHTSGLNFKSPVEEPTLDMLTLQKAVRSYAAMPLLHEPDSKYLYSNEGINTAGRIIEVVSGMSYETFLDVRLFEPLGMKDTTFWPNQKQLKRLVTPHKPNAKKDGLEATKISQLTYPLDSRLRQPMPGGGLFSSTSDVARFCQMILNGGELNGKRYISEASIAEMGKRQTPAELKESYGLGWSSGKDQFGHGGALATNMTIYKDKGLALIYMVQHQGYAGPDNGKTIQPTLYKAAFEKFGK
ncbi:MAG TPA: serine hydrolase domain-containing protein [Verrucomicrobiae bacterium]